MDMNQFCKRLHMVMLSCTFTLKIYITELRYMYYEIVQNYVSCSIRRVGGWGGGYRTSEQHNKYIEINNRYSMTFYCFECVTQINVNEKAKLSSFH